ncbi:16511_t:CDS:2, partial [Gigaspora margarita]
RKCEDGTIDNKYPIVELDIDDYSYRTDKNMTKELKKKLKIVNVFANNLDEVVKWIINNNICSLNVSGARKSNLLGVDLQVKM